MRPVNSLKAQSQAFFINAGQHERNSS